MKITVIRPPSGWPVTLHDTKDFLRVTHDAEDGLIQSLIEAATTTVETYVNRRLLTQTIAVTMPFRPGLYRPNKGFQRMWSMTGRTLFYLPIGPTQKIISVSRVNEEGHLTPLLDKYIHINETVDPTFIILDINEGWGACVEYVVGYGDTPSAVPMALRMALLRWVGVLYEHRSDTVPPVSDIIGEALAPFCCQRMCL